MNIPSYQKDIIKWLTGVACTVGVLSAAGHFLLPEIDSARIPASLSEPPTQEKDSVLKGAAQEGLAPDGKGSGSLKIEIHMAESVPYTAGQLVGKPIQIEAVVQAMHAMKALQFAWHLPRGVTATSGDVNGELGDLEEGESRTLSLVIVTSTEDNRQVHLNVFRKEGAENMGGVAQFNTVNNAVTTEATATHGKVDGLEAASTKNSGAQLIQ